jgi:hypothetical protein
MDTILNGHKPAATGKLSFLKWHKHFHDYTYILFNSTIGPNKLLDPIK